MTDWKGAPRPPDPWYDRREQTDDRIDEPGSDMPTVSLFEKQMRNMWIAGAIAVVIALLMIGYALAEFMI